MSFPCKHVAVIGAGISGVVAAAHLRKEGVEVTVFERSSAAGGIWYFTSHAYMSSPTNGMVGVTTSESLWSHHTRMRSIRELTVFMQAKNSKMSKDCFMRHQGMLYELIYRIVWSTDSP
jgi:cation diffusion facilitator CzcD-associated flavoprotein CzcO